MCGSALTAIYRHVRARVHTNHARQSQTRQHPAVPATRCASASCASASRMRICIMRTQATATPARRRASRRASWTAAGAASRPGPGLPARACLPNTKGYSRTDLDMVFANVRAGTQKRRDQYSSTLLYCAHLGLGLACLPACLAGAPRPRARVGPDLSAAQLGPISSPSRAGVARDRSVLVPSTPHTPPRVSSPPPLASQIAARRTRGRALGGAAALSQGRAATAGRVRRCTLRLSNTKGYSSTYLAMGFANVRAGTWYSPEH